ncbi:MAG: GNAT family N-acetyltransferase [Anaerolineae bacterium]|nr:GNAT family N-acetyltransferase [Thermoflexales bacterium]MDW8407477.1 GNAT family N-acetyltransferase [Anaerolineae bacterium]
MSQIDTRTAIAPLLTDAPADALASYFTLEHDARRVRLIVRRDNAGRICAFVAVCQTGVDLFRPLLIARGDDSYAVRDALSEALAPGRQYLFSVPLSLRADLEAAAHLYGDAVAVLYALRQSDFKPVVNILVQTSQTPDGLLRASIPARGEGFAAEAGTSWISRRYAEIFVHVAEAVRGRGLGKSVVSAVSAHVLALGKTPLYLSAEENQPSRRLALALGYHDTGARELTGACARR